MVQASSGKSRKTLPTLVTFNNGRYRDEWDEWDIALISSSAGHTMASEMSEQKQDDLTTAEQGRALASERLYRRLFETARDGILILDGTTGQITDVNPFMMDLLGYSREEFLGKELREIGLLKD
jgi:PAS domain-containing protein